MTGHPEFPHLDEHGRAWMIDITGKEPTVRRAVARGTVRTVADVHEVLVVGPGVLDPVHTARVAGVQAAKQTSALLPLCHPIRLTDIQVDVVPGDERFDITAVTEVTDRTGVEMEALTACTVAGLTIVCALSTADPAAYLDEVTLWLKEGGRSGRWERPVAQT
ncbi:MAG TPA: cyclic pyranopterin monophosphate synthase MoaC [Acidimicrobiales bacterium]|nr:cyclic pyranopterin monophosphate synthase MoaC [Acidimicrobiales bacterium]